MPNAELAQQILNAINQHPENFDMHGWFARLGGRENVLRADEEIDCGTTMCLAGWACHLSGYTLISRIIADADPNDPDDQPETRMLASKDGVEHDLWITAMKLLGIKNDTIFYVEEDRAEEWLRYVASTGTITAEATP